MCNWFIDQFAEDQMCDNTVANLAALARLEKEAGRPLPCEDDVEVACPYVDMLPEESNKPEGSPLRF